MATLTLKNVSGNDAGTIELDDELFAVQPNVPVMHQVVTAQLAARRSGTQSTKTRADVSGGGRKPYAQKGTGNARQGSIRAPHFTGGGVALGPKPRKYDQKTPKKMIKARAALGVVRPGQRGQGRRRRHVGHRDPQDQGRQAGARRSRHRPARRSWWSAATTPQRR